MAALPGLTPYWVGVSLLLFVLIVALLGFKTGHLAISGLYELQRPHILASAVISTSSDLKLTEVTPVNTIQRSNPGNVSLVVDSLEVSTTDDLKAKELTHHQKFRLKRLEYEKILPGQPQRRSIVMNALDSYPNATDSARFNDDLNIKKTDVLHSAVLAEWRNLPELIPAVLHFLERLPQQVYFFIFHGDQNSDALRQSLGQQVAQGQVQLINLKVNLTKYDYQWLFMSSHFWWKVAGENLLIFQTDTALCQNSPHKLQDFLRWDFVGAPCIQRHFASNSVADRAMRKRTPSKYLISGHYNGGLSLRKKSKMLQALRLFNQRRRAVPWHVYEDVFFSSRLWSGDIMRLPPPELANHFCIECKFYANPIGIHRPWERSWFDGINEKAIRFNCPEIKVLFGR